MLPYPDEDPTVPRQSQNHLADVKRTIARSQQNKGNKFSRKPFCQRPRVYKDSNTFSPKVIRTDGDAFGSGWEAGL